MCVIFGKHVHIFSYLDMLFFYYYRFGFVTYSNPESVDACLRDTPHKIDEKLVETKRAVPREDSSTPHAPPMTTAKTKKVSYNVTRQIINYII